eukprot:PhM_4_TR18877/c0_g1_i2/m.82828/K06176/truD, PUS7; tRNA pseudouridine13 synthase
MSEATPAARDALANLHFLHTASSQGASRPRVTFKKFCQDFEVREVDVHGNVTVLDMDVQRDASFAQTQEKRAAPLCNIDAACVALGALIDPKDISQLHEVVPQLESRKRVGDNGGAEALTEFVLHAKAGLVLDKSMRSEVHGAVREHLPTLGSSMCESDTNAIVLRKKTREDMTRWWPRDRGEFLHFTLKKENMDTMTAISYISSKLRIPITIFGVAGTKDKRAVTHQRVSAWKTEWKRIEGLNKMSRHVAVGNPTYQTTRLWLGALQGNHFIITLRDVKSDDDVGAMRSVLLGGVQSIGFPNYFGPQRFGTTGVPTHHVGQCILKGAHNYRDALTLVIQSKAAIVPEMKRICEQQLSSLEDLDANTAQQYSVVASKLPQFCRQERDIFKALERDPRNYSVAWARIPRNQRCLYVHSLQSYVWNAVASARLSIGSVPMVGDLVLTVASEKEIAPDDNNDTKNENNDDVTVDDDGDGVAATTSSSAQVRCLTAEDDLSLYRLCDVVLPLVGPDVQFPNIEQVDEAAFRSHLRALGAEGLLSEAVAKEYNAKGGYRQIVVVPQRVTFEKTTRPEHGAEVPVVEVGFSLPSGTYATSLLREVCVLNHA